MHICITCSNLLREQSIWIITRASIANYMNGLRGCDVDDISLQGLIEDRLSTQDDLPQVFGGFSIQDVEKGVILLHRVDNLSYHDTFL